MRKVHTKRTIFIREKSLLITSILLERLYQPVCKLPNLDRNIDFYSKLCNIKIDN